MRPLRILATALALCAAQIACMAFVSGARSPSEAYFKLLNWDSEHYVRIAETGYSLPAGGGVTSDQIHAGQANVVFFPGYPMAARLLHEATGMSVRSALLLVAHLSCLVFWIYFLLLLREAGAGPWPSVLAVAAYPSSFFLVAGYTEPLFLAAALGFIYWSERWDRSRGASGVVAWLAALLHGWVLGATRIVGFAVAAYPVFRDLARRRVRVGSVALLFLSVLASVAFFAYCQLRFGDWAVYFKLEEIGWHNHRMYLAIVNPLSYVPHFFFEETVDSFSRASVTLTGFLLLVWGRREWKLRPELSETRLARGAVAFTMFYIALTGKADAKMDSMIRYTFPVYLLLVLNFAELRQPFFTGSRRRWKMGFALALGFGIGLWNMYRFTHGKWVA